MASNLLWSSASSTRCTRRGRPPPLSPWADAALGIVPFDPPLPPVRVGVADGEGGVTLGFASDAARAEVVTSCANAVRARCLDGARYGCTLAATRACAPPVWKRALGLARADADAERRTACEAVHRRECARAAAAACTRHAGMFCTAVVGGVGREGGEIKQSKTI